MGQTNQWPVPRHVRLGGALQSAINPYLGREETETASNNTVGTKAEKIKGDGDGDFYYNKGCHYYEY